jgi:hypothetical protein
MKLFLNIVIIRSIKKISCHVFDNEILSCKDEK